MKPLIVILVGLMASCHGLYDAYSTGYATTGYGDGYGGYSGYGGYGGYSGGYGGSLLSLGYGGYGQYGGYGSHGQGGYGHDDKDDDRKPIRLTCLENDANGNGIAANIRLKKPGEDDDDHHQQGFGYGYGNLFNQGSKKPRGIKADFEVRSQNAATDVQLVITTKSFVDSVGTTRCQVNNFGDGLKRSKKKKSNRSGLGGYGFNFHSDHIFGRFDDKDDDKFGQEKFLAIGSLAEFDLTANTIRNIGIHELRGYNDIHDLAGRGLMTCTQTETTFDHRVRCTGGVIACCTLGVDHRTRALP